MSEPMLVTEVVSSDRKRIVRLLVVAAAVVVVALIVPRFLFGDGAEPEELEFPASAPATPTAPDAADDGAIEVVRVFSTRNPFTPLVSMAAAPAQDPTQGEAVAVVTPEAPVVAPEAPVILLPDLGTGFPTTPPPTAPPVTAPPATTPPAQDARFALAEVFQDAAGQVLARVRINDVVHEVAVGHDFAEHYRFVSADLATRCASFLFGDNRFELCEGEETRT